MRNFILLVVGVTAIYLGVAEGWSSAFWLIVAWGCILFVVYAVVDLAAWFWDKLTREREITFHVYDQAQEDEERYYSSVEIVDAEILKEEERKRKRWWEV